jgi:hypothetical protein
MLGLPGSGIYSTEHVPPAADRSAFVLAVVAIGLLILLASHG